MAEAVADGVDPTEVPGGRPGFGRCFAGCSLGGLVRIWLEPHASPQYYPFVFSILWVEHALWGFNPVGFHLVNVLLHASSAVVLWRLFVYLKLPGGWLAGGIVGAALAGIAAAAWPAFRAANLNVLEAISYE